MHYVLKRQVKLSESHVTLAVVTSEEIKFLSAAVFHYMFWKFRTWCILTS